MATLNAQRGLTALLALALAACAAPPPGAAGSPTPAAPPPASATSPPAAPAASATADPSPTTAATVEASPTAPAASATPAPASALPRAVYFISAASGQVVRLEADGVTETQVSFEEQPVRWLATAPGSGTIVYVAADDSGAGRLIALDGAGRRQLIAGTISFPALSPDGQTVAYRLEGAEPGLIVGQDESPDGVWSSSTAGMRPGLIRADLPDDDEYDPDNPAWVYAPVAYSPDGSRLALYAFDSDGPGIPGGELLILGRDGSAVRAFSCCEEERWSADGSALTVAGGGPGPDLRYGLFRIDAASGAEQAILGGADDGDVPLVVAPQQLADGQIYAFVELLPPAQLSWEYPFRPALSRVGPDGAVTPLRPAEAPPAEVLWDAAGAGALVTAAEAGAEAEAGGELRWLPLSGEALPLAAAGRQLRWAADMPLAAGDCAAFAPLSYEPPKARTARDEVGDLQRRLAARGLLAGPDDGLYGEQTREAVAAFQTSQGLPASGDLDCATWQALLAAAR